MTDPELNHQSFGLTGRSLCIALFGKYLGLSIYGIIATVIEVPTFVAVGSSSFALAWAASVATFAILAAIGVARTWVTGRYRLEKTSTAIFVLTFLAYSFALFYRGFALQEWGSVALAIIPIVVVILPTIRYYSLVSRRGKNFRRNNA